ncbi:MAG: hypothetical protein DRH57_05620 [Candidatus Cloacimonadota bacterium]|nr:MAG: hypothetical protein DRH57_05620 [Candidatus Cloacimonadota bacterium]
MEIKYKIRHGSKDSIDEDFYLVVDTIPTKQEFIELKKTSPLDLNLITIDNGAVTACLKGLPDEINNSIFSTFDLHAQEIENPIKSLVPRDVFPKLSMVIREMLAFCSRTQYRSEIKRVMKSANITDRLNVLSLINLNDIDDFEKNTKQEVYKFFAQQIGMILPLLKEEKELFTKRDISDKYALLGGYLYRREEKPEWIQVMFELFGDLVMFYLKHNVVCVDGKDVTLVDGRVFDVKYERYIGDGDETNAK